MRKNVIRPLLIAGIYTLIAATGNILVQAQETQEPDQEMPVEVTPPSEQTHGADNGIVDPDYRDDRTTPQALIEYYYNAINRKEYGRAYSSLKEGAREMSFNDFVKGYENTKSVKVAVREAQPDPGAGQIYWSLPIAIEVENENGAKDVFGGCYRIHLTNASMQEGPLFKPMMIMTGT